MGPDIVKLRAGVSFRDIENGTKPEHLLETAPEPEAAAEAPPDPIPTVQEIEAQVRELRLEGDEWTDISRAAVILLGAPHVGNTAIGLQRWSGYPLKAVRTICGHLRRNLIFRYGGRLAYFSSDEDDLMAVEFCLLAMAGAGMVERTAEPAPTPTAFTLEVPR